MAAPLVSRPSHDVTAGRPPIEWYPGHIAKAERLMTEVLSMVDVVVELRDARIPDSTAHPMLASWIGSRGHILALNRMDAAPAPSLTEWAAAMGAGGQAPVLIDAKKGGGVAELKREIEMQSRCHHPNLLRLLAYSSDASPSREPVASTDACDGDHATSATTRACPRSVATSGCDAPSSAFHTSTTWFDAHASVARACACGDQRSAPTPHIDW